MSLTCCIKSHCTPATLAPAHTPCLFSFSDWVSHHWSGWVDGNGIGVLDQLDVRRRCCKVGQIVIDGRWRQNSALCHSCFHLSTFRFLLPKMIFDSSVQHIVVEPATDCCRHVVVEDTIEQLLMVYVVDCGQNWGDECISLSKIFSWEAGKNVCVNRGQGSVCRVLRSRAMLSRVESDDCQYFWQL